MTAAPKSDFDRIRELEDAAFRQRQIAAGIIKEDQPTQPLVGFGLSGGGIRSATFSLGIFQSLARVDALRSIDLLSTVSGGGYFGSFLGRLFTRKSEDLQAALPRHMQTPPDATIPQLVQQVLKDPNSQPNKWLRENGRFLAPNGGGDLLLGIAIALRNWMAIHIVLAAFLLWLMLCMQLIRFELPIVIDSFLSTVVYRNQHQIDGAVSLALWYEKFFTVGHVWWSPWLLFPLLMTLFCLAPMAWAYWLVQSKKEREENYGGVAHWWGMALLAGVLAIEWRCNWPLALSSFETYACKIVLIVTLITLFVYSRAVSSSVGAKHSDVIAAQARNRVSSWLAYWLATTLAVLCWSLIDSLGETIYAVWCEQGLFLEVLAPVGFGVLGIASLYAQKLAVFFGGEKGNQRPGDRLRLICTVLALGLAVVSMSLISAVSHAAVWGWKNPTRVTDNVVENRTQKSDEPLKNVDATAKSTDVPIGQLVGMVWRKLGESLNILQANETPPPQPKVVKSAIQPVAVTEATLHTTTHSRRDLWLYWSISLIVSLAFARIWPFLNRSSLQSLYNTRLRRAYLGASNPARWQARIQPFINPIEGDGLPLRLYKPHAVGGPVHLINVTINETVDGRTQVQQQDRHGVGMAVGPCGISVGVQHHAVWCNQDMLLPPPHDSQKFQVFEDQNHSTDKGPDYQATPIVPESLELSEWAGVSGAAFSTGLGIRTSLSLSLLAGAFNVRLGHWWDSGVNPHRRSTKVTLGGVQSFFSIVNDLFPIPMYLLDEFTARFHGTARQRWYLTDGGHFENMGGYELIRRRVPLIVICDGEEDSRYVFEGLSTLVRKAFVDFDAEICFWTNDEIESRLGKSASSRFGELEDLRRVFVTEGDDKAEEFGVARRTYSKRHAAIATVRYDASRTSARTDNSELQPGDSLLIYIKSTLTNDETADVRNYADEHPKFPHESTIDQFFDEAQWESYRKLGEHIGWLLFNPVAEPPRSKGTGDAGPAQEGPQGPWPPVAKEGRSTLAHELLERLIPKPPPAPAAESATPAPESARRRR